MKRLCIGRTRLARAVVALTLLVGLALAQETKVDQKSQPNQIQGTWFATFTFSDGSQSQGLLTFEGSSIGQGTLIASFSDSLTPPFPCLAEQGVWRKESGHTFVASDTGFCYDASNANAFFGLVKAKYQLTASEDGKSLGGQGTVAIVSTSGVVVFSDTFSLQAVPEPATSNESTANLSGPELPHRRAPGFGK